MKKLFILVCSFVFLSASGAFAYDDNFKKSFYDGFVGGFFTSLSDSLEKQNVPTAKVKRYTTAMKARLNRKDLEAKTWSCVEKYNLVDLFSKQNEINQKCFSGWQNDYLNKNADLLKLLQ